ncbi:hypothetical protein K466DRAFT_569966, partial [Polyporus arcularius HHB13444]
MSYLFPTVNATSQGFVSLTRGSTLGQQTTSAPSVPRAPSTPVRSTAPPLPKDDSPMSIDRTSRRSSRAQSPMDEILSSATYAAMHAPTTYTYTPTRDADAPMASTHTPARDEDAPATSYAPTRDADAPATSTYTPT